MIKYKKIYKRSILKVLLRYIIAALLLIYISKHIPLSDIIEVVNDVNANLLCAGLFFSLLIQPVIADRLRRLAFTQSIKLTLLEIIKINLSAIFYGLFLPGGNFTGMVIRLYKLSGNERLFAGAGVVILLDKTMATITLCATGIIFFLLDKTSASFSIVKFMILIMSLLLLTIGFMYFASHWIRLNKPDNAKKTIIFDKILLFGSSLERIKNLSKGILFAVCCLSFIAHLMGILTFYLITLAMGLNLSFITVAWIRSGIILATMIPVSISGLGLREGAAYFLMNNYGIIAKEAISFSLIIFATTVFIPGLLGGLWEIIRWLKLNFLK